MILSDAAMPQEKVRENAQAIKSESERISTIIHQLLDFARRGDSQKSVADLRQVVRHAVDLIQPLAAKQENRIEVRLPDSPVLSEFDFNQMQQVVMNLIDNAVDASQRGESIEINLAASEEPGYWALDVVDRGPGVDAETRANIFEPFFTTKDVGVGTGLGLSIVYGIVQEHGGTIELDSQPGQGSRFRILLPKTDSPS